MGSNQKFLNKIKKIITLFVFFVLFSNLYSEKIVFSANNMSGKTGDSSSSTTLKGNAYILTETIEIKADLIELYGDDYRYIKGKGRIEGKNLESLMEFTCDSLDFDRETKIALLSGNVNLVDTENEVNAKAQRIEYDQEKDIAVLQIEVNLTQKDNVCSGAYAVYHKKEQMLEISGNAQVRQGEDTFRAQNIVFNMETEDITLGGNVKGSVRDSKKEEDSSVSDSQIYENETIPDELESQGTEQEKISESENDSEKEKSEKEE